MLSRHSLLKKSTIDYYSHIKIVIELLEHTPKAPVTKLLFYYSDGITKSPLVSKSDMLMVLNRINRRYSYFQNNVVIYNTDIRNEIENSLTDSFL